MREKASASIDKDMPVDALVPRSLGHLVTATVVGAVLAAVAMGETGLVVALAVGVSGGKVLSGFVSAYRRGEGDFPGEARWQIASRTLTAVAIVGGWLIWGTLEAVLLAWIGGLCVTMVLPIARFYLCRPVFEWHRDTVQICLAFLVIDAATALYFRIDIVMLELLIGDSAVTGNYAAGFRLLEGVIYFMAPLSLIFFRQLRRRWRIADDFDRHLKVQMIVMAVAAAAIFAVFWLFGREIVVLAFGNAYAPVADVLAWLFGSLFFVLPNAVLTQAFIALNREWRYALGAISAAVANIGLNFWLIPSHGMWGAAFATLMTEGVLFVFLGLSYARGGYGNK